MAFDERARDIRPCRRFCQRHHRRRRRRHLPRDGSSLIVAFACEPTPGVTRMRDRVRLLVIFGETAYGITRQRDNACNGLPRSENRRTRVSYEFQDRVALHCVRSFVCFSSIGFSSVETERNWDDARQNSRNRFNSVSWILIDARQRKYRGDY